jgi:hypothetical protein
LNGVGSLSWRSASGRPTGSSCRKQTFALANLNDGVWSALASQHFPSGSADVLQVANFGLWRMNMEMPETELETRKN